MELGSRQIKAELEKTVSKSAGKLEASRVPGGSGATTATPPSLPMIMQQAIAMQQLQFQQPLLMQQAMASQQAATRAASVKSAAELATLRALEISKCLKADGGGDATQEEKEKSASRSKSRSKSRSPPVRHRRDRRSRSFTPIRYRRDRRSRSRSRDRYQHRGRDRSHYRGNRDGYPRYFGRRDWAWDRGRGRDRDRAKERDYYHSRTSHRSPRRSPNRRHPRRRSRSLSPRYRRDRDYSPSPRRGREDRNRNARISRRSRTRSPSVEAKASPSRSRSPSLAKDVAQSPPMKDTSPRGSEQRESEEKGVVEYSSSERADRSPARKAPEASVSSKRSLVAKYEKGREPNTPVREQVITTQQSSTKSLLERALEDPVKTESVRNVVDTGIRPPIDRRDEGASSRSRKDESVVEQDPVVGGMKELKRKPVKKGELRSEETHTQMEVSEDEEKEADDWRNDVMVRGKQKDKENVNAAQKGLREEEVKESHIEMLGSSVLASDNPCQVVANGLEALQDILVVKVKEDSWVHKQKDISQDVQRKGTETGKVASSESKQGARGGRAESRIGTVRIVEDEDSIFRTRAADEVGSAQVVRVSNLHAEDDGREASKRLKIHEERMSDYEKDRERLEDDYTARKSRGSGEEHMANNSDHEDSFDVQKGSRRASVSEADVEGDDTSQAKKLEVRKDSRSSAVLAEEQGDDYDDVEKEGRKTMKSKDHEEEDREEDTDHTRRHRKHRKRHRNREQRDKGDKDNNEEEVEEERDSEGKREKRRHRRKHRREDDSERRERKKRRHKHRRRRSSSESPDLETGEHGKSKGIDEDTSARKRSKSRHKKKSRHSRSPSSSSE